MKKQLKYDFSTDLNRLKNLQVNESIAFLTINTKNCSKNTHKNLQDIYHAKNITR